MSPAFSCLSIAILSLALASTASPAAAGAAINDFLEAHNDARATVGVPPLAWNTTVELDAVLYARELRANCDLQRLPAAWPTDGVYGRNLFRGSGYQSGVAATAAWVGEGQWYRRRANSCAPGKTCGDYTQVVWNSTRQLGCARIMCLNTPDTVAVCKYFPPGNYPGKRPY